MKSNEEKFLPDKIIPLTPFDVLHTACKNFLAKNPQEDSFDRFFAERFAGMYKDVEGWK